ncbi:MAG: metallophosphoesterase [Pedobacter sp.]|nr:metallophosphoesterase [Chitinophagaceae bacterium]
MFKQILSITTLTVLCLSAKAQKSNYKKEAETGHKVAEIKGLQTVKKSLNFLVMGDWGRHGEPYQKAVAEQMTSAAVGLDATFVVAVGDNFYPKGVISEYDPSWKSSFEDVYHQHPLFIDWYVVLGNHDYKTNPDAEVAYSKISARWHMPSRYFSVVKTLPDGSKAEFFYIDSSPFQTDYYSDQEYGPKVATADTSAQKKWLENGLKNSTANWKFVVGHHPLYSAGKRKGKTGDMLNSFAPLFEKYKVDAYFCGHEHHLEFDQPEGYHFVEFISGAAAEATPVTSAPYAKFVAQEFGFLSATLTAKEMLVQFINHEGKIIYTTSIKK